MIKKIQKKIKPTQAFLVTNHFNVQYLTNFTGTNGTVLLANKKAFFLTDPRYTGVAKKVIPNNYELIIVKKDENNLQKLLKKLRTRTVLIEAGNITLQKHKTLKKKLPKIQLKPEIDFIEQFRIAKTEKEIQLITKSQRINEKVFQLVKKQIKPGVKETELAWMIGIIAHDLGAELSFSPIIAFGSNSGTPHHKTSYRKFKKGDIVLIDMGMKYKDYCSDMTRVLFTKTPTNKQVTVYNTVLEAQQSAIKQVKADMTGIQVDKIARNIIKKAGYEENFTHSLGHGIGLEIHENPHVSPKIKNSIPKDAVITIEPGIYLENSFGIRIEDMVLVEGKKAKNLTRLSKKIEDLILYK